MTTMRLKPRPLALYAIAVWAVLMGVIVGVTTNTINSWVSPAYTSYSRYAFFGWLRHKAFLRALFWPNDQDYWHGGFALGIGWGLFFGVILSALFTVSIGVITRRSCSFTFAFKYLLGILLGVIICWAIGGLIALGATSFYCGLSGRKIIFLILQDAWVGGSTWGVELGVFLSLLVAIVLLRAKWLRQLTGSSTAPNDPTLFLSAPPTGIATQNQEGQFQQAPSFESRGSL
jgi:hypothetical protein